MTSVLVVGQVPPPYGGQAVMIRNLLRARYGSISLVHVPMRFSREMNEMGRFSFIKIGRLFSTIAGILAARARHGCRILYYPPAGHAKAAIIRDLVILIVCRPFFRKLVLHFHAGGLSQTVQTLPFLIRRLAFMAYGRADCSIRLSALNPDDGRFFESKQDVVIPYGIEDEWPAYCKIAESRGSGPRQLLYMGLVGETKGVMVLLDACRILKEEGRDFELTLAGCFESDLFKKRFDRFVDEHDLQTRVQTPGVLTGKDKWAAYARADVFCYPTFFESETFGLVVLEAMQFSMPVVAARWRGVPSLVSQGRTGLLVPVKDSGALAAAISEIISNPELGRTMGRNGRQEYCSRYKLEHYHKAMEQVFLFLATGEKEQRDERG